MSIVPNACTVQKMLIALDTAPGTGNTQTFVLRTGSNFSLSNSSSSCTISGSATTCSSTTNVSLSAGQFVDVELTVPLSLALSQNTAIGISCQ
jgi:hypothetical protein